MQVPKLEEGQRVETHVPRSSLAGACQGILDDLLECYRKRKTSETRGGLHDSPSPREEGLAPSLLMQVPAAAGAALALGRSTVSQQNPPILGHGLGTGRSAACRSSEEEQQLCFFAGPASGTAGLCHGCGAMGTQTGCGGKVLPWPDPGEEEVSGEGICSVGAEEVTWARKGWVWEKLQKSLARGRTGDSAPPRKVLVSHHLDCCLQESRHEDGHTRVTHSHWVQLGEKELASRQGRARQSSGE